jgi:hypothetical protein
VFISHKEIDVRSTSQFNSFTKEIYEHYVASKEGNLDDSDPIGYFSLDSMNCQKDVIRLSDRSAKYVLVKLLAARRGLLGILVQGLLLVQCFDEIIEQIISYKNLLPRAIYSRLM